MDSCREETASVLVPPNGVLSVHRQWCCSPAWHGGRGDDDTHQASSGDLVLGMGKWSCMKTSWRPVEAQKRGAPPKPTLGGEDSVAC